MPFILDKYIEKKINKINSNQQPIDKIGELILGNPQGFNLDKTATQLCLSHRQFEKGLYVKLVLHRNISPGYVAFIKLTN